MKSKYITTVFLLMWASVLVSKELFLFGSLFYCFINLYNKKIRLDKAAKSVMIIALLHCFSIILYVLFYETENNRVFAAFNTALSWIVASLGYSIAISNSSNSCNNSDINIEPILIFNTVVLDFLAGFSAFMQRSNRSLSFLGKQLYIREWINGTVTFRSSLFFEYCSLITCFALINLGILLRKDINKGKVFLMCLTIIPVYFSKSRICILAYLIFAAIVLYSWLKCSVKDIKIVYLSIGMIGIIALIVNLRNIEELVFEILYARENSNVRRQSLYLLSLETMWKVNPITGVGVKTMYEGAIPLGSHSTYIGILYKVGILGFILSISLFLNIVKAIFHYRNIVDVAFIIAFFIIFALEDIDGTNWLVFYIFAYIATVHCMERESSKQKEHNENINLNEVLYEKS